MIRKLIDWLHDRLCPCQALDAEPLAEVRWCNCITCPPAHFDADATTITMHRQNHSALWNPQSYRAYQRRPFPGAKLTVVHHYDKEGNR